MELLLGRGFSEPSGANSGTQIDQRMGRPSPRCYTLPSGSCFCEQLLRIWRCRDRRGPGFVQYGVALCLGRAQRSRTAILKARKPWRTLRRLFDERSISMTLLLVFDGSAGAGVLWRYQPPTGFDGPSFGDAALTRLGIVVESISKFARELGAYSRSCTSAISKEVIRRYVVARVMVVRRIRRRVFQNGASAKRVRIS